MVQNFPDFNSIYFIFLWFFSRISSVLNIFLNFSGFSPIFSVFLKWKILKTFIYHLNFFIVNIFFPRLFSVFPVFLNFPGFFKNFDFFTQVNRPRLIPSLWIPFKAKQFYALKTTKAFWSQLTLLPVKPWPRNMPLLCHSTSNNVLFTPHPSRLWVTKNTGNFMKNFPMSDWSPVMWQSIRPRHV